MFTEGLDNSALRWVTAGCVNQKKEVPYSISNLPPRIDPYSSIRSGSGGRGFGLPPPSKFRSGHLSSVIPVYTAIPGDADDSGSASENDQTTDSEEEVYGGRYSLDSSPQDDRVPNNTTAAQRYYTSAQKQPRYASGSVFSDAVSSSRETMGRGNGNGNVSEKLMKGANRYPVGRNGSTEDDSSDSAASSEFSSTQVGSNNGAGHRPRPYVLEGYASSVPSRMNAESAALKDSRARNLQNEKLSDDDFPSAPPFGGSAGEIKQDAEQLSAARSHYSTRVADLHDFSVKNGPKTSESISSQVKPEDSTGRKMFDQSTRSATGIESRAPSGSVPARLPTFHASAQGPWHAVIAYDACVRLCLHAWAKEGCEEAPMFLDNECALLRNAFGLLQVLLQSEEELLAKRSSELATEGTAPKPKKMVGKMKVQGSI
ncbi:hypothetical protein U1Q18_007514 [Sarracenia purpurea var. burkii]